LGDREVQAVAPTVQIRRFTEAAQPNRLGGFVFVTKIGWFGDLSGERRSNA
jgi:hypothetical protein